MYDFALLQYLSVTVSNRCKLFFITRVLEILVFERRDSMYLVVFNFTIYWPVLTLYLDVFLQTI